MVLIRCKDTKSFYKMELFDKKLLLNNIGLLECADEF